MGDFLGVTTANVKNNAGALAKFLKHSFDLRGRAKHRAVFIVNACRSVVIRGNECGG
jgi:hypothetical protein